MKHRNDQWDWLPYIIPDFALLGVNIQEMLKSHSDPDHSLHACQQFYLSRRKILLKTTSIVLTKKKLTTFAEFEKTFGSI